MNYISSIYYYYGIFPFVSALLLILFLISEHKKNTAQRKANKAERVVKEYLQFISDDLNNLKVSNNNNPNINSVRRRIREIKTILDEKDIIIDKKSQIIADKERELGIRNKVFEKILTSNLTAMPYLAGMMADYLTYDIEVLAKKLDWGTNQAREKKVQDIRAIRNEAKERIEAAKEAEYELNYLLELYPELQDVIDTDYKELFIYDSLEQMSDNYDRTRQYLTSSEWQNLSFSEKNQLALDRYVESRNKNKWQIGRDYEESIAYNMYESNGWQANPIGITKKLEDMGRDIIATRGNEVEIVQCKYWSRTKVIHEKHIFQLFGTSVCYSLEHKEEGLIVSPVFVTNIELSPVAREAARYLNVRVIENYPMKEYPRIKCNIGKDEYGFKTFIYHLPMDQQYDNVKINAAKGEFKAYTVKEAEDKGFRRAYRWHNS